MGLDKYMRSGSAGISRLGLYLGLVIFSLAGLACPVPSMSQTASAPSDTLVLVNGEPIRAQDLDRLIMEAHKSLDMNEEGGSLGSNLIEKRVNDILLIQDALAAGMGEDPDFITQFDQRTSSYIVQQYVKDNFQLPKEANADSVRAFFGKNYWRIQYRQMSLRTRDEAEGFRSAISAGADMDSLAREISLDTKNLHGGLHNLLHWVDVPYNFRNVIGDLEPGDLTEIFPLNDSFAFLRIEQRLPLHEEYFPEIEKKITAIVYARERQKAWDDFVLDQKSELELQEDMAVIASIVADSSLVLDPKFKREQPEFIIELRNGPGISGTEFRAALAFAYKSNTSRPFSHYFSKTRELLTNQLALAYLAEEAGYGDSPEVQLRINQDWEKAILELYLDETVANSIRFNQQEFQEFYEKNQENFRGPDEVRLDFLIIQTEEEAQEVSQRLKAGADFGRIFSEVNQGQEMSLTRPKFIKETELSDAIREEISGLELGQSSAPLPMGMGFMVFRYDARRPGPIPPLEMVEMPIRRALFNRKFDLKVQEVLKMLKANSEIIHFDDRIQAYYSTGGDE